ncbi:CsgG/HfaB family protein [uncultured Selenomonas sp.]|uniref:CsgG/HfaB family protein n=1 Tax=uncultured Selenomonas sp. TaxID=159275 RepID=UPI0025D949CB|nr:CsgG/HfaB family protein [uncultured Selenomonas sp.]
MIKKWGSAVFSFCLCAWLLFSLQPAEAAVHPGASVAVVSVGFYGQNDVETRKLLAEKATEFVGERMFKDSKLTVKNLEEYLPELQAQGIDTEGNIDADAAEKIGKLLNVDYVVYGNILSLSVDQDSTGVVLIETDSQIANAEIMLKMVDTQTDAIVATGRGRGSSRQTSGSVVLPVGSSAVGYQWGTDRFSSKTVDQAIINASEDSVQKLLEKINMQKPKKL